MGMGNQVILIEDFLNKQEIDYIKNFIIEKEDEILNFKTGFEDKQRWKKHLKENYADGLKGTRGLKLHKPNFEELYEEGASGPPGTHSVGKNITSKVWTYNIFDYKEIYDILAPKYIETLTPEFFKKFDLHKYQYDEMWIRGWGNLWRRDIGIMPHQHYGQSIHAYDDIRFTRFLISHIFLSGPEELGTHYLFGNQTTPVTKSHEYISKRYDESDYYHNGKPGQIAFTTSDVTHWVNRNESDIPRISIAGDIRVNYSNYNWYQDDVSSLYLWKELK